MSIPRKLINALCNIFSKNCTKYLTNDIKEILKNMNDQWKYVAICNIKCSELNQLKLMFLKLRSYRFKCKMCTYSLSDIQNSELVIVVEYRNKKIAHSNFHFEEGSKYWTPDNVLVEDAYRGQHIGPVMYLLAVEILKEPLIQTHNSSDEAKKMWKKIRNCIKEKNEQL